MFGQIGMWLDWCIYAYWIHFIAMLMGVCIQKYSVGRLTNLQEIRRCIYIAFIGWILYCLFTQGIGVG